MLAYVQGLSTSNIELLWRILAEQTHVLVCTGVSLQHRGTKNQDCKQLSCSLFLWWMPVPTYVGQCLIHHTLYLGYCLN
jgi:hypothetical protein